MPTQYKTYHLPDGTSVSFIYEPSFDAIHCTINSQIAGYVIPGMTARTQTRKALDFAWLAAFEEDLLAWDFDTERIYCKEENHVG
jgi:hypothetical protein